MSYAFSASEVPPPKIQAEPLKENRPSQENRQNKKYQLSTGIGNDYSFAAYTFSAGYFIDPSQVITFRYSRITQDQESEATYNELHKIRAYTLGYKKFFGKSFFMQPTAYYRKSSTDYVNEGSIKSIGTPNLIYDDIGVGFRVGNEWQWNSFLLGVDWFGMNKTIHEINSKTIWQGSPESTSLKTDITFTIISVYLGLSF